jgi:glycerol-3-phosphate acyltransferase PlsX
MAAAENAPIIALDAMGGDKGPSEVVKAIKIALSSGVPIREIRVVGQQSVLEPLLKSHGLNDHSSIRIFHASEVIGMDEKPIQSLKTKKDSSLVRAVELVKSGDCSAAVSCGNTGSLMACGTLKLRMMEGVERPALGSIWPSRKQHFVMLDVGANPSTRPDHYVHNAVMGSHYARLVLNRPNPRVALLSIGTEESKGNEIIQEAHEKLKSIREIINYVGPIEGFDIFEDAADVVVCDGFTGNALLKGCESLYKTLKGIMSEEMRRSIFSMAGALLCKSAFSRAKERLNPDRYAGAPLLGLRGNVLKSHGSSNAEGIAAAIRIAGQFITCDLNTHCQEDIARANKIIRIDENTVTAAPVNP